MKILTRLSKEGSSAEEPLNIPLSDYSSDEGDTSTSSSEDEAGKDSMAELEGPCCSSLRVPPSSPVLPQKLKGNKKNKKQPPKSYRRRSRNAQRIVLDIPTAEPASDFFDFTSDEESPLGHHRFAASDTENRVKKNFRRRYKRHSDRIKKLTALGCETQFLMPPELIVRSATSRYMSEDEDDKNKMVISIIKEFPPVIGKERLWQGFNRANAERTRELTKPITPDNFYPQISFRRSIWTGTHSDGYVNEITLSPKPLSWGVPPVLVKSAQFDNEALLTACSQKLAAWKDEKRHLKERHHRNISRLTAATGSRGDKENRSIISSAVPRTKLTSNEQHGKPKLTMDKKLGDSFEGTGMVKVRKKTRNTLNKISEKAEMFSNLSRSARSSQSRRIVAAAFLSSGSPRKATSSNNLLTTTSSMVQTVPTGASALIVSSQSLKTPNHQAGGSSKFKTGGIVVTAAQPFPKQRKGTLRAVRTPITVLPSAGNGNPSPTKLPPAPTTHTIDLQLTTLCSETESEKNLRVQIGSKKHKKKRMGNKDKSVRIVTLN